uniref:Carboxylic ester hydrolase n=1 Tax=Epiphyas postvittana TaxID=65032 RepID=A0A0K8TV95_EPIPO
MISAKWLVLWSLWAARLARQPTAPLRVSGGRLRGSVAPDGSHAAYLGIPYATITPENRFKDPGPEPKWDGIFEAYNDNVKCTQRSNSHVMGQEDCLVVNVHAPLGATSPLPVLVFIHGGGFRDGSGSPALYGPQHLVKQGVILVTFNYRLEVMGFLCLGTKDAPGNMGMKDQVAALQWVRRNIRAFGGDPDNVTLFGESAGAASVSLHLISPMSKGLFHKAIMQSGTALAPWSLQFEPVNIAKAFVKSLSYTTESTEEIYKILMTKSAKELLSTRVPRKKGDITQSENIFVPCVERKVPGVEQFLPDSPYNLMSRGQFLKIPMIVGYNNAEGYLFVGKENDTTLSQLDFAQALPRDLLIPNEDDKLKLASELKHLYMGDKDVSKETLEQLSSFEGDLGITYPVLSTIDLLIKTNTQHIFTYRLDYDGWLNVAKAYFGFMRSPGATHADDLFYMFKPFFPTLHMFERDMLDKVTSMWTNFAKFGDPTPEYTTRLPIWLPTDSADPYVFVIDKKFSRSPLWEDKNMLFWNQTYSKFRRKH